MNAGEQTQTLGQLLSHAGWLRRLAGALMRDPDAAEDVVQGTLVAAWQRPREREGTAGDDVREQRSWLSRVARNQALDQRRADRRRQAREQTALAMHEGTVASPEQLVADLQIHREVAEIVSGLEQPYQQAVVLRYYQGLTAAEVARKLGVPAGTVRWRLKEGLDRVRVQLDARHGGDRRRWMAALAPLAAAGARPPALPSGLVLKLALATAVIAGAGYLGARYVGARGQSGHSPGMANVEGAATSAEEAARSAVDRSRPSAEPRGGVPRFTPSSPGALRPLAAPMPLEDPGSPGSPRLADALMRRLLAAAAANDYDGFLEHGDDQFKAVISPELLRDVSTQIAPLVDRGFSAQSLGTIRKSEGLVHLWKVQSTGVDDDLLIRMTMDAGKVTGFRIE